ncbi:hypothetical protein AYI70_g9426 [Smittium culicis]|uniref:Uncharacterized protein n=1 Tax=Smittium culicis TaxID=133412 RepID=A0A1R1XBA2_9FUNG|nr:hypothetical protein AYI70_g9426 [Smittium culicis]
MEQATEIQAPESQCQIKVLKELVQQIKPESESNQEPEDPYVSTRMPFADLSQQSMIPKDMGSCNRRYIHEAEVDMRPKILHRPPEAKAPRGRAKIKDRDANFNLQNSPPEGFPTKLDLQDAFNNILTYKEFDRTPWNGGQHQVADDTRTIRTKEPSSVSFELMEIDSDADETGNP